MDLPKFKYHPDPVRSEVIKTSDIECICCGKKRGYIYVGPVYSRNNLRESLCPWCIANGSAHEKFDASFTDPACVGGYGENWDEVTKEVMEEVAYRTPGFIAWQSAQWWTHCSDAAELLGIVEIFETSKPMPHFLRYLKKQTGIEKLEQ